MTKLMYKVHIAATGKIALFESRVDAEKYVALMQADGHTAVLNKWSWETTVED